MSTAKTCMYSLASQTLSSPKRVWLATPCTTRHNECVQKEHTIDTMKMALYCTQCRVEKHRSETSYMRNFNFLPEPCLHYMTTLRRQDKSCMRAVPCQAPGVIRESMYYFISYVVSPGRLSLQRKESCLTHHVN